MATFLEDWMREQKFLLNMALLKKVEAETEEVAKVEAKPKMEGRQMIMVIAPRNG